MRSLAQNILRAEPVFLAIVVAAFWFPDAVRVNSLMLLIIPLIARIALYRRLSINTPLNIFLFGFLGLTVLNTYVALADPTAPPYSWGWYVIGRPIMGVALALCLLNRAYERARIDDIVLIALLVAVLVGILGLGSAQYTNKSTQLQFLIQYLPEIRGFPGAEGGFNVNEIGGAMAFFAPFAAGIMFYDWRERKTRFRRGAATLAFVLLALALFLGQSRLAIAGVVAAMGVLIFLLIPVGRWRYVALAGLLAFVVVEGLIVARVFEPPETQQAMNDRDEDSFTTRLELWSAGLNIIRDLPLTGVGQNQYRSREVRVKYPVPGFGTRVVPHAHNEVLQVGTDLGIPGMILFVAWNATLGVMVWQTWRKGDPFVKAVGVSAGAGLLAHTIFGVADAITLYDRFVFAYWLMVGLVGGAYVLAVKSPVPAAENAAPAENDALKVTTPV